MDRKFRCLKEKGFTLIELLIVIAVISILIGIALPRFKGMQDEGNIARAKGELRTLQTAVESFYIHNSQAYPATLAAVNTATPSIVTATPTDPFSSTSAVYGYTRGGTNNKFYIIFSVGAGGNGSAAISGTDTVTETNGSSCIYASNIGQDAAP